MSSTTALAAPAASAASRAARVACIALPLATIFALRAVLPGAGPAGAGASGPPLEPLHAAAADIRPLNDPPELIQAVRSLLAAPAGRCTVAAPLERSEPRPAPAAPKPVRARTPTFTLTSIAGGGRQNIAVIDGKVRRVGDELGEGWTVSAIDPAADAVTLAGPDGETQSLSLRPR